MSPFAFSAETAEARNTVIVGVSFTSWTTFGICSTGVGDPPEIFELRAPGRREACAVFFSFGLGVGRGWKAFEMDCPTFLKKSPTGSAMTQRPLKRNSAAAGKQTQRESMRRLIELWACTFKPGFFTNVGG
jgi:hypothetical protein